MSNDPKPKLRSELAKILVPEERLIKTGQGCWNCKHWDREAAKPLWTTKRQNELSRALAISLESKQGENDDRVVRARRMINDIDHLVATKHLGVCRGGGRTADGQPVGDFVTHAFLCDRWSGAEGASLAREGGKLDPLPEERAERIDGPKPPRKVN